LGRYLRLDKRSCLNSRGSPIGSWVKTSPVWSSPFWLASRLWIRKLAQPVKVQGREIISLQAFDRHYLYWWSLEGETRMRVFGCDRQLSPRIYPISVSGREVYTNAMSFYSDIG
jgi:hypothetical protein